MHINEQCTENIQAIHISNCFNWFSDFETPFFLKYIILIKPRTNVTDATIQNTYKASLATIRQLLISHSDFRMKLCENFQTTRSNVRLRVRRQNENAPLETFSISLRRESQMSKETQLIAENMVERLNLRQWPLVYTANVIYAIPPNGKNRLTMERVTRQNVHYCEQDKRKG